MSFLKKFFIEEDGQDLVEYGLLIALLALAAIAALAAYTPQITAAFTTAGATIKTTIK